VASGFEEKLKKNLLGAEGACDSFLHLSLISAFITHFCILAGGGF